MNSTSTPSPDHAMDPFSQPQVARPPRPRVARQETAHLADGSGQPLFEVDATCLAAELRRREAGLAQPVPKVGRALVHEVGLEELPEGGRQAATPRGRFDVEV